MHDEARRSLAYQVDRLRRLGQSRRQIAKSLQIHRKTVAKLIKDLAARRITGETVVQREVRPPPLKRASTLDEHDATIREWLKKWSNLTAQRCLEMLQERGFVGGYTIVRERLKKLRREVVPAEPPAVPFKAAPGQRAEFDWSPYTLDSGDAIQLFSVALRFSRAAVLEVATDTRQTTTLQLLRVAFEEFGGVPAECLTDSMPGVVDRWEHDEPVLNVRYIDFAAHYGYTALTAPRRCPQWKAVAERLFGYHETSFLNGRTFRTIAEYADALAWWQREHMLERTHTELGRPVREIFELERPLLQPLPAIPYDTRDVGPRVVDAYGRVQWATNHYPAGGPVGTRVYVCVSRDTVEICDPRAKRLAQHGRLPDGAGIVLPVAHVARRARYDVDELCGRVSEWGEVAKAFAERVRARRRTPGPELVRLLSLQIHWSIDDVIAATQRALDHRCTAVADVERILEADFARRSLGDQIGQEGRARIKSIQAQYPVETRPLGEYGTLRDGDNPPVEPHDEP